jgi:nitrogen fixation protein FixH
MANDYQMTYREVDKNYDKIVEAAKIFDSKYIAKVDCADKFTLKSNHVSIKVDDISGKSVSDINVTAVITRPETSMHDIKLTTFKYENGHYVSAPFDLPKEGRWQVSYKLISGNASKYVNFEGFARSSN